MNGTQTQTLRGGARFVPILGLGSALVAVAIVAAVALGGGRGNGANGGAGGAPASQAPSPSPIVTPAPTEAPSAAPTAEPTAVPSDSPTDGGSDGMPIKVDLDNVTGDSVYVDIVDRSGGLVDAVSGTPGDGASVDLYTLQVENVDERTLKLTWIDYPIDSALALFIDRVEGGFRFVLVQPEPTGDTDTVVFDRELILTFADPISADQVETFLQDGLDTAG
jgi:hypothetical protein